ncbi:metalloregulator ArsR/SmtB family transcription factor [Patescibacteria group bacterium]|nr:metalloregulator ArsR/SmtB family transcription factor [Patescibacteria group bacterium]
MAAKLENIFKVLSEPNRLRILKCLEDSEKCVCMIYKKLDLPQNLISHHLAVMRKHKVLNYRREGKSIYYSVNQETFKVLNKFVKRLDKYQCWIE